MSERRSVMVTGAGFLMVIGSVVGGLLFDVIVGRDSRLWGVGGLVAAALALFSVAICLLVGSAIPEKERTE